jgi:DNA-binding PadR family transcriptional regulator
MDQKHPSITLEYILLGLLADNPDHGYALYEKVKNTPELSLIWQVKRSKLYYLLDKLAGEDLLSFMVRAQEGYPDRKIYQLTEEGTQAFQEWLSSPVLSSRYVRIAFLSKLYFALQRQGDAAQNLIDAQLEVCLGWLSTLTAEQEQVGESDFISYQVYQFRLGQISAMITWLENCREKIQT